MTKRIAALTCCLSLVPVSVVAGEGRLEIRPALVTTAVVNRAPEPGPIQRALLSAHTRAILRAEKTNAVRQVPDSGRRSGNWMERHPVWTGALVGFGTGVGLTYVAALGDREELLTVMSPGSAAVFWGGVSAGVGALAGWGIGRHRDE
jgi:hypothetical protein